ncbi:50S ribosomal protein L9 [Pelagibacteraceae bacterium]|jgi:large subunit ribosomal protein L9|nr:50S ribosomal protein L9 [Pelagibacteraceae bacterium]|tara:strand:+ start:11000 stop:11449 length:450 start_codon:yes stop_codon:yes gene_type:complete
MQVILLENIIKLGKIGDLVNVKNGYGRNYLLKTGKALRASKENIEHVNKKKTELNKKNTEIKLELKDIANKIDKKVLKFTKEAKDSGELFGSIKPKEIASSFINDLKVEISPGQIDLNQEIDKIGQYKIKINLHSEVSVNVTINVTKKD